MVCLELYLTFVPLAELSFLSRPLDEEPSLIERIIHVCLASTIQVLSQVEQSKNKNKLSEHLCNSGLYPISRQC